MKELNSDVLKNQVLCFIENDDNSQYFDKWIAGKDLSKADVSVNIYAFCYSKYAIFFGRNRGSI